MYICVQKVTYTGRSSTSVLRYSKDITINCKHRSVTLSEATFCSSSVAHQSGGLQLMSGGKAHHDRKREA